VVQVDMCCKDEECIKVGIESFIRQQGGWGRCEQRVVKSSKGLECIQPRKTDFQADDDLAFGGTLGGR
jgi:hypothetical protein